METVGLEATGLDAGAFPADALGAAALPPLVLAAALLVSFACAVAFKAATLVFAAPLPPAPVFAVRALPSEALPSEALPLDAFAVPVDVPAPAERAFFIGADILGTPVTPRCGDGAKSGRKRRPSRAGPLGSSLNRICAKIPDGRGVSSQFRPAEQKNSPGAPGATRYCFKLTALATVNKMYNTYER